MHTNNLSALKKTVFVLAIGWTLLIAFLCLITFNDLPSVKVKGADKMVHVTFYFVLIMLWGFYSKLQQDGIRIPKIFRIVIISILYGIVLEILQETLTTTRHADMLDVLANSTGATLALALFALIKKRKTIKE
jgi:VanZ family protein